MRIGASEIIALQHDPNVESAAISVVDDFGDYGICGFYAMERDTKRLLHFLFSCRILNLGVERYIYEKLGMPKLDVVGDVSSDLFNQGHVDWISETAYEDMNVETVCKGKVKLLFLGGCDLELLCHYMDKAKYECITDFIYPSKQGVAVHKEHTYLRDSKIMSTSEKKLVYSLPFGDEKMYQSRLFDTDFDILIYSVLMNYTHEVYRSKSKTHRIAYGGYMD